MVFLSLYQTQPQPQQKLRVSTSLSVYIRRVATEKCKWQHETILPAMRPIINRPTSSSPTTQLAMGKSINEINTHWFAEMKGWQVRIGDNRCPLKVDKQCHFVRQNTLVHCMHCKLGYLKSLCLITGPSLQLKTFIRLMELSTYSSHCIT